VFLTGLSLALVCSVAVADAPPVLKAGTARSTITPPLEIPFLTSSGAGTNAPFKAVHDDLFARALVLDDGRQALALLAVDSIGYDNAVLGPGRDFTAELRQRIAARTGLQPEAILVAASHTHSAPETIGLTPLRAAPGARDWLEGHLAQLADTVVLAWQQRRPVRVRAGSVAVPGLQRYRRIVMKDGTLSRQGAVPPVADVAVPWRVDEMLHVIYLETMEGAPYGVVMNYTAHPVVAMLLPEVSADYPGAAAAVVEAALPGVTCLFLNGCAGNINAIAVATNFDDVAAIGGRLGRSAVECVQNLKAAPALTDTRLAVLSETCTLASRPAPALAEARREAEANPSPASGRRLRLAQKLEEGPIRAEVQAMALGPLRWVALPGEPFVETGLALKEAGASFVVGYANGYVGYLPIERAYKEGGYEVELGAWSRVAPGSAERLQVIAERLLARLPAQGQGTAAVEDRAARLPPVERLERVPPLPPEQARQAIQPVDGFRVELVAAEPLVRSPIALDFDEDGRMYVVEYPEYNDYAATRPHGHGAIRRLEDRDGDGRYEHAVAFADDVPFASGVLCYDGGVFVAAAPDLLFLKDTTGDGRADVRERVLTGFERDHAGEAMLNGLRWGLDHRVHLCTGMSGGAVRRADRPGDAPVSVRNMGVAFEPRTRAWSLTGGGGQYGLAFDDWGRKFVCSNSTPIWQVMYDNRYLARNPFVLGPPAALSIAPEGKYTRLFRKSPVEAWRVAREQLRQRQLGGGSREEGIVANIFTSGTGITVYRGDAYPAAYRGNVFVGEVANNLVFQARLEPQGAAFRAVRAHAEGEFLASKEIWFRPVFLAGGPDGCLYVVDMHRELIEGAEFLPDALVKQLDPSAGVDRGRIYRVVPEGLASRPPPRLSQASTAALVALLEHPDGWHRDTAARLLSERRDPAALEPLHRLAARSPSPLGRLHALYTLAALEALTAGEVIAALGDVQPELRENAAILAERFAGSDDVLSALATLCDDPQVRVRCQTAFSLGLFPQPRVVGLLVRLARRDAADRWVRLAILCSSAGRAGGLCAALMEQDSWRTTADARELLSALTRQIGAAQDGADIKQVIQSVNRLPESESRLGRTLITQLMLSWPAQNALPVLDGNAARLWAQVVEAARRTARDETQAERARVSAVETLSRLPLDQVRDTFRPLLEPRHAEAVQRAVLECLARYHEPMVAELILESWPSMVPGARTSAIETLLSRGIWAQAFLQAIEQGRIARAELDADGAERLRSFPDPAVRLMARRVLAGELSPAPGDVVARYRAALSLTGDLSRGRELFRKNCSGCHQLEDYGRTLGADLHAIGDRGAEAVFLNILDPNREVKPNYLVYALSTIDGQVINGMITAETATSLSITQADGGSRTVLRREVEALRNTGRSFMPQGFEKQITVAEMADLLAYLLAKKAAGGWKAGTAKVKITPERPVWMSGYPRDHPAEGTLQDLWAKAIALEDAEGRRALLITMDLVGIDRTTALRVCEQIAARHGLKRDQIALNVSHTHCGPVIGRNLEGMFALDDAQWQRVDDYTNELIGKLVALGGEALAHLRPSTLAWGQGYCTIAVNRRANARGDVERLRATGQLQGPSDYDVPVLAVRDPAGALQAVVFGYACHATVLDVSYQWCGDYPGYAQAALEEAHPGAMALFWAGCGGDQAPRPRATVALTEAYGKRLAMAVDEVLAGALRPLAGPLLTSYDEIDLRLAEPPGREVLLKDMQSSNVYIARRAAAGRARRRSTTPPDVSLSGPALAAWRGALALPGGRGGRRLRAAAEGRAGPGHLGRRLLERRDGLYPLAPRAQGRRL
jgi:putative membrane-bound dehydrogenase-like protein